MLRSATVLVVLVACNCLLTSLHATQITYNVDVGGLDQFNGHPLRVQGTVLFDTELQKLVSTKLNFHHGGGGPGLIDNRMNSQPTSSFGQGTYWHWLATPTELRFVTDQDSNGNGGLRWSKIDINGFGVNSWGSFQMTQYGFDFNRQFWWEPSTWDDFDFVRIPAPATFGDPGMLFGTAVPEPSTLALAAIGILGLLIAARRKR